MRVTVDRQRCIGSGMCVITADEVFAQRDEDGTVRLLGAEVADELGDRVRQAAHLCPSRAITVGVGPEVER
ncbi:ferredoxin [Kitasatospora xanthocidica]|uniref:Ferredoxin n=1 Tax=Kitasatospora xanthocidica TaxID=83382 RepID=A0A373A262_9ACTN|nr:MULTISPECIES: ferredoxin [Streptomycetaceae]OKI03545.1 ferredoxin [Streptomyces sp. CB02056]RGD62223.1 ferredoxin [Kitasatospora xanthocidica]